MALRDKQRCLASDAVAYVRYQKFRNASKQRIAKERDLVVVRNHAVTSRREKTGEEMVWASHLGFLHRIWLIGVRQRVSRIWEDKEVSPKRPTLVKPSERFQVEWYYYANTSHGTFLAIIGGLGGGEPGPRAVFLSSRREFSIAKGQGRYRAVGIILRR